MPTPAPPIGLIGLGLIGSALAERLCAANHPVHGYDVDPARRQSLADHMTIAASPAEVFATCDRILLSLPDSSIVRTVLADAEVHLRPGHLIIDTTTGAPSDAVACARQLAGRGAHYLDATLSGSSAQVRAAQAVVLVGGDRAAFDRAADLFPLFSRRAIHVGPAGSGATMKLVTNLVLGLNRAALAEGLAFAKALGLDPAATLTVMQDSAAYSHIMDAKGPRMVTGDFAPDARLSQHLKDVRLILASADAAGLDLPLSEAHRALLESAEAAGLGQLDNSAIIRAYMKRGEGMIAPVPLAACPPVPGTSDANHTGRQAARGTS